MNNQFYLIMGAIIAGGCGLLGVTVTNIVNIIIARKKQKADEIENQKKIVIDQAESEKDRIEKQRESDRELIINILTNGKYYLTLTESMALVFMTRETIKFDELAEYSDTDSGKNLAQSRAIFLRDLQNASIRFKREKVNKLMRETFILVEKSTMFGKDYPETDISTNRMKGYIKYLETTGNIRMNLMQIEYGFIDYLRSSDFEFKDTPSNITEPPTS